MGNKTILERKQKLYLTVQHFMDENGNLDFDTKFNEVDVIVVHFLNLDLEGKKTCDQRSAEMKKIMYSNYDTIQKKNSI